MATQEMARPSLAQEIRVKVGINRQLGDRKSNLGFKWYSDEVNIDSYDMTFRKVLNGFKIRELLIDKESPVAIDLMGPSNIIASLLEQLPSDMPKFGIAVSLEDRRGLGRRMKDRKLNVRKVGGDLVKSSTWDKIEEQLAGRKADLIMERAGIRGFDCMPRNPKFYAILLNKAWNLLSENGGALLVEVPEGFDSQAAKMIDRLKNDCGMDASIGFPEGRAPYDFTCIKLVKTPNSPEKLPFPQ